MIARLSSALLCALAMSLLAPLAQADALSDALAQLNDKDYTKRNAGRQALEKVIAPEHKDRLITFFKTCQSYAASYLINAVERKLEKAAALEVLKAMMPMRKDYGAAYAAMAVHRLGDPAGWTFAQAVLKDPAGEYNLQRYLVGVLSVFGSKGQAMLVTLGADESLKPALRAYVLERMASQKMRPEEKGLAEKLKSVTDAALLPSALLYRYCRGDGEAGAEIDKMVLASKYGTSQLYVYLDQIITRKDTARKAVLLHLADKGTSAFVKIRALRGLAAIGMDALALRKARAARESKDEYFRREARRLALEIGGRRSIDELRKELKGAKDELERVEIAQMLAEREDFSGEEVIYAALSSANVEVRRTACSAARSVPTRKSLKLVTERLGDADTTVSSTAYSSVRSLITLLLPYRRLDWSKVGFATDGGLEARKAAADKLKTWLESALK